MIIEREILKDIWEWIERPEIIVIVGSRQVGKTTLLKILLNKLNDKPNIYFDLENFEILEICNRGPKSFVDYLKFLGFSNEKKVYVALDEIQYLKNPSNFLKIIHDHYSNIKLIVSGSSSLEIKKKFKNSLAGRKIVFELNTFNFSEFLTLKGKEFIDIKKNIGNLNKIIQGEFNSNITLVENNLLPFLSEYLTYGGYPAPSQEPKFNIKIGLIKDIYNSYIKKDIRDIAQIEDILIFNNLIKILSSQVGGLINIKEISNTLNIDIRTLKKYLFLLENTFVINLLSPYFKNKRKEISKMPKVYFYDVGMRNIITGNYESFETRSDRSKIFENFVFTELMRRYQPKETLFHWRTLSKAEVDFIIIEKGNIIPIEVKCQRFKIPTISKSLQSFIEKYKPEKSFVININFAAEIKYKNLENCKVYFLPAYVI